MTVPLAPRTARTVDLAVGERTKDPSSSAPTVSDSTATPRRRIVHRIARRAGITKRVGPCYVAPRVHLPPRRRRRAAPYVKEAASHVDLLTTMRDDRARVPSTATPPTSSPPSSPAPPADHPHAGAHNRARAGNMRLLTVSASRALVAMPPAREVVPPHGDLVSGNFEHAHPRQRRVAFRRRSVGRHARLRRRHPRRRG